MYGVIDCRDVCVPHFSTSSRISRYFVEYRKEAGIEWSVHLDAGRCFYLNQAVAVDLSELCSQIYYPGDGVMAYATNDSFEVWFFPSPLIYYRISQSQFPLMGLRSMPEYEGSCCPSHGSAVC